MAFDGPFPSFGGSDPSSAEESERRDSRSHLAAATRWEPVAFPPGTAQRMARSEACLASRPWRSPILDDAARLAVLRCIRPL